MLRAQSELAAPRAWLSVMYVTAGNLLRWQGGALLCLPTSQTSGRRCHGALCPLGINKVSDQLEVE